MLGIEPVGYPKPDNDDESREALLPLKDRNDNSLPNELLPLKAAQYCPLPVPVCHLKWWLTKYFVDPVDIFHMYAEMGNDEYTQMWLKFQDSWNPSGFVTTPKLGGTGLTFIDANDSVMAQMFWVLNEQRQAFAQVVWLGQHRVPQTWHLNMSPGGYDNWASDLHQHSGVAQIKVLEGLMCRPNIMTMMIY